jgi:glycogen synthase
MKVLMTTDTVGGVWSYTLQLCAALQPHNVSVVLATMGAPLSAGQRRAAGALRNVGLKESTYALEWMDDPWDDVAAAGEWLLDLERETVPDLIHVNGYAHAAMPWRAPALAVAHSCVLSWWRAVHRADAPVAWSRYARSTRCGLHAADLVIAPTRAMLDALHTHYGELPRAAVIPNGVDSTPAGAVAKQQFVLAAGRIWDAAKNMDALDAAAPHIDWPVLVAGSARDAAGRQSHLQHARQLGVLSEPMLSAAYARAAILAHPSRYEPFGLAPLEAALHGCALVLGDIASLREVWGDAAVYVEPDDDAAIAHAINRLIRDESLRHAAATRARSRAGTYTAARMAASYVSAYRTIMERARPLMEVRSCAS